MEMIDQLLARAEADLEVATRRREIAQALAADWAYWAPLLGGATVPQDAREAVAKPPGLAEAAAAAGEPLGCQKCGGPIPPSARRGGRPRRFCSAKCGHTCMASRRTNGRKRLRPRRSGCRPRSSWGPSRCLTSGRRSGRSIQPNTRIDGCRSS